MIDMDGDGIVDLVRSFEHDAGARTMCALAWRKGQFGGSWEPNERTEILPTRDWLGKPQGYNHPSKDAILPEFCSLDGQHYRRVGSEICDGVKIENITYRNRVGYHYVDWNADGFTDLVTNTWRAGPSNEKPVVNDPVCGLGAVHVATGDGDERECRCLPGAPANGCMLELHTKEVVIKNPLPGRDIDSYLVSEVLQPDEGVSRPGIDRHTSLAECAPSRLGSDLVPEGGLQNPLVRAFLSGPGGFRSEGMAVARLAAPWGLPGVEGGYSLSGGMSDKLQTRADIDGDGYVDQVATPHITKATPGGGEDEVLNTYSVPYLTVASPNTQGGAWKKRAGLGHAGNGTISATTSACTTTVKEEQWGTLLDMNGDGLPDFLNSDGGFLPNAADGFAEPQVGLYGTQGYGETHRVVATNWGSTCSGARKATRTALHRFLDVDQDGLPDLVVFPDSGNPTVKFNLGDRFAEAQIALGPEWNRARRRTVNDGVTWAVESDFADVTGDGVPDLVEWTRFNGDVEWAYPMMAVHRTPQLKMPRRLLTRVDNGRGLLVDYSYASSNDPAIRDAHSLEAAEAMPWYMKPTWVVTQVKTTTFAKKTSATQCSSSTPSCTTAITTYRYALPITGRTFTQKGDPPSAASFVGFAQVRVIAPAPAGVARGPEHVSHYEYTFGDSRGYKVQSEQLYFGVDGKPVVHSVATSTWKPEQLFPATPIRVVLSDSSTTFTCRATDSVESCKESPHLVTTRQVWQPLGTEHGAALFVGTLSSKTAAGRTTQTDVGHFVVYDRLRTSLGGGAQMSQPGADANAYWTAPGWSSTWEVREGGGTTQLGKSSTLYNEQGAPSETREWASAQSKDVLVTAYEYDLASGFLLKTIRPEIKRRLTCSGPFCPGTTHTPDPYHLYAKSTTNEANHESTQVVDLGTGQVLASQGPAYVSKVLPPLPSCGSILC
jgi:hypothetical protein